MAPYWPSSANSLSLRVDFHFGLLGRQGRVRLKVSKSVKSVRIPPATTRPTVGRRGGRGRRRALLVRHSCPHPVALRAPASPEFALRANGGGALGLRGASPALLRPTVGRAGMRHTSLHAPDGSQCAYHNLLLLPRDMTARVYRSAETGAALLRLHRRPAPACRIGLLSRSGRCILPRCNEPGGRWSRSCA